MSKPLQTLCSVDTGHATISFLGRLLGTTTSRQDGHFHPIDRHASRGERCYACRWSEYRLYEVDHDDRQKIGGRYLVVSYGHSTVPDETTLRRVNATDSPAEVIELLTTRKFGQRPVITSSAARLLARASDLDADIQEAWDNRVVL